MERSTCVICGKKRKREFLKKCFGVWVCNHTINRSLNYIKLFDGTFRPVSKCEIKQFEQRRNVIYELVKIYNDNLKVSRMCFVVNELSVQG